MNRVFFGPRSISGIGQVTRRYSELVGGEFIEFGQPVVGNWDVGFAFVLPLDDLIQIVKGYTKHCKKMVYYTICETEPVNDDYAKLFELTDTLWTSSQFCSDIFKKQFPQGNFPVLHLFAPNPRPIENYSLGIVPSARYIFYHIGNVIDQRKNIHKLIECFYRANIPDSLLVLKATCHTPVSSLPKVFVINDFLTQLQLEYLHDQCNCYVSFAHSEGAGMGAVEAALRNKPVIIQEYGGTKEYIKTPYIVPCSTVPVGRDDFLFKKDHVWGEPSMEKMIEYMQEVSKNNLRTFDHSFTRDVMKDVSEKIFSVLST